MAPFLQLESSKTKIAFWSFFIFELFLNRIVACEMSVPLWAFHFIKHQLILTRSFCESHVISACASTSCNCRCILISLTTTLITIKHPHDVMAPFLQLESSKTNISFWSFFIFELFLNGVVACETTPPISLISWKIFKGKPLISWFFKGNSLMS